MINVISYDSYKISINRVKKSASLYIGDGTLEVSHIWRHIEASWMFDQGIPIDEISYKLGHLSRKTTEGYIRKKLHSKIFVYK
jgi:integrase